MSVRLREELRHSSVGLLLGLIGVGFGLFWAVYLTVNHDSIHRRLEMAASAAIAEKFVTGAAEGHEGHGGGHASGEGADHSAHSSRAGAAGGQDHAGYAGHEDSSIAAASEVELLRAEVGQLRREIAGTQGAGGHHSSPDMAAAHGRLAKGHVHAMGLGILSIAVAMLLGLLPATPRAKTLAAACVGTGGLFYPFSWILMGMRTTALGAAGAEQSVLPMVGLSVALVALGVALTLAYALRWLLRG